ncbi:DNA replication terminus site-binding protein [Shewanella benthica]|uniref:DNA replication terminus site-binding protein n=1 Tax=Shewanella benthica KT99 TaxID=314608 RepID=A9CZ55_9GAMM|nr:DNA replication terminus site-binding protein [Shewanella benthica]EDQ02247.1 DNA replication terminus site-binding protein [Shewanella benthica KT99]
MSLQGTANNANVLQLHRQLEQAVTKMLIVLGKHSPEVIGFSIPSFEKREEDEQPEQIQVQPVADFSFTHTAFSQWLAPVGANTRLVKRYPGVVILSSGEQQIIPLISEINRLKDEFAKAVRLGFKNRQSAHENLHKIIPGILLQQATRKIHHLVQTVSSVNFYWAHRPMVKEITKEQALADIDRALESKRYDLTMLNKTEIEQRTQHEKSLISRIPADARIIERRIARVQPCYDIWIKASGSKTATKLGSKNASLPVIIFGKVGRYNGLSDYCRPVEKKLGPQESIIESELLTRKSWFVTMQPKKKSGVLLGHK